MSRLSACTIVFAVAAMALTAACGSDGSGAAGGAGAGGVAGGGGSGGFGGTSATGGSGGGDPYACHSTVTANGSATPTGEDAINIAINEADGVQVVSGSSGNTLFEALYASDMAFDKSYMGPDYALFIDIPDQDSGEDRDSLQPKTYTSLGSHGAWLQIKYDEGFWHQISLELDEAAGDFVTIEDGTTPLYDVVPSPGIKASYQLTVKGYNVEGQDVAATGTVSGRFDGCDMRQNDATGEYQQ